MPSLTVRDITSEPATDSRIQQLEEIFQEHYRLTYRTAYAITGAAEDAEDIVQSIFLGLLRREVPPDLQKNPGAYLYRAAVNGSKERTSGGWSRTSNAPGTSLSPEARHGLTRTFTASTRNLKARQPSKR